MRNYDLSVPRPNYFAQGFRLGLIFGTLGALIMLGRRGNPKTTL
ncbi:MAG TPA: hypothetical protein VH186_23705 [Chloroflexia bacterium]|nr:hypothetical protein [Chloroflexia bacterium]